MEEIFNKKFTLYGKKSDLTKNENWGNIFGKMFSFLYHYTKIAHQYFIKYTEKINEKRDKSTFRK